MSKQAGAARFGIFHKILWTMLLVAALPLGIVWFLDYGLIRSEVGRGIDQRLQATADQLAGEVDQWVAMNRKVLQQNAALADIASMQKEQQDPILRSILHEYRWSYLVFTTDVRGMNIGRSDDADPKDYSDRDYVRAVIGGGDLAKQILIGRTSGKPALILAAPIPSPDAPGRRIRGVIAMAMHIAELSQRITDTRIGATGFAFILDEAGKIVAHPQEGAAPATTDFSDHPAFAGRPQIGSRVLHYRDGGRDVIAAMRRTETGWYVVAQQDQAEAYAPLQDAQVRGFVVLGVTLIAVAAIAYVVSRGLSGPIRNLTRIAEQLSRGGAAIPIDEVGRKDEIGQLAAAIDRMGASIRLAMDRLKKRA